MAGPGPINGNTRYLRANFSTGHFGPRICGAKHGKGRGHYGDTRTTVGSFDRAPEEDSHGARKSVSGLAAARAGIATRTRRERGLASELRAEVGPDGIIAEGGPEGNQAAYDAAIAAQGGKE